MNEQMENKRTISKGLVVSIILIALLIVALIIGNFLYSENKYYISSSIIIMICLLVVLVLSNSFDYLSIDKIITLKREVNDNKEKVKTLEKERSDLYLKLFNMNLQSQKISITNGMPSDRNFEIKVDTLDEEDKLKKSEEDEDTQNAVNSSKRLNRDKFESIVLKKYFGISRDNSIKRNVKVVEQFQDIDSIGNKPIYFDAYLNENNYETFIDIRRETNLYLLFHDRLYVQLNKILLYKNANNCNTQLLLIIARTNESTDIANRWKNQIENYFKPAKRCGLLKIVYVDFSKEEYETCLDNK